MRPLRAFLGLSLFITSACVHGGNVSATSTDLSERSRALAQRLIIADGHIDVPYRLGASLVPDGSLTEDISQRTPKGDFDYPRAVEGGLDVAFMSIYISADLQTQPGESKIRADRLIDLVEGLARSSPEKFALAYSPDDAERNTREGKLSFALGIENGSALEDSLENVAHFQRRGVRYITLTHSKDNALGDSSYNEGKRTWNGLSPLGRRVVAEMNRVGIMVDIAHVSDDVVRQVLELSQVPVIASHSSCRHFTPGFERNLSDELIQAVAAKGGVVMINFGSGFLTKESRAAEAEIRGVIQAFKERNPSVTPAAVDAFAESYLREHPLPRARVEDVADHIDHVVKRVGIDHVGLGSDFDGVGPTLPVGLEDVSKYPNLFRVLLERGYSEADLEKLASGNVFRVWRQVEAHAARK
ncbi:dipeptidase [Melittangium boletus]|uniref:Peptidase M19 n=1 Tax=Melittangium boletus DSM 14713 TaxID=1294270 RepID=A0A250INZ5_9BACT|nr:dipeptidase [Melittangium boletus]ATB32962.1 peptidase M19 [Melittangium boletus DSM 14713]